MEKNNTQGAAPQKKATNKVKSVRNRSGHKIELLIDEKIVVFMPGKTVEVPMDFEVPTGLGLYVR